MPSPEALLALVRWRNALLAAGGVAVGAWWAHGRPGPSVLFAALAAIALTAAANAWNDLADVDIDRVAHPGRPLVQGSLTSGEARALAWGAAVLAIPLAALAHPALGLLTVPVLALMWAYSPWLKRAGLVGNLVVAVLASLPFLYGAWAVGSPGRGLVLVAIGAPLHLARELAKDLDDAAGDARARRTLPLTAGVGVARAAVVVTTTLFVFALTIAAEGAPHFAIALVPAIFLAAAGAAVAVRGRRGAPRLFKLAMLMAMLAVIVARP